MNQMNLVALLQHSYENCRQKTIIFCRINTIENMESFFIIIRVIS